jgi:hypothetical protein
MHIICNLIADLHIPGLLRHLRFADSYRCGFAAQVTPHKSKAIVEPAIENRDQQSQLSKLPLKVTI